MEIREFEKLVRPLKWPDHYPGKFIRSEPGTFKGTDTGHEILKPLHLQKKFPG
jgi:hypothetical protein